MNTRNRINIRRSALAAASAATLALTLASCSDSGSDSGSEATAPAGGSSLAGAIKASGSSAQKNAIAEWINAFQTANPNVTIDYQANGSGAGIQDFINGQTSFAGSDSALKADEQVGADKLCTGGKAVNIPMVGGAIAVAYHLDGVDSLVLNPDVIAKIFNNSITKWNDAAIAELNPGVTLPDATIAQFHRSDESGTTANFTSYLSATAPDVWTYEAGKAWTAPGGQGSKGSDGVASSLDSTRNSIGYVELSFVTEGGAVKAAKVDNGGGAVEATSANAAKTIEAAKVIGTDNDLALQLDPKIATAGAYPIVLVTYEITCDKGLPAEQAKIVKEFLTYTASASGQGILEGIGYVPITGELLTKVNTVVTAIS
ncbi:MAG: phosphate ABC transporter substrate-binding protein PstS [Candidatus Nanopelagicales bacterium]